MIKQYQQIVIFVLTDGNKILVEKRPVKGFVEHQYILTGGAVNPEELNNLEVALKREMQEELGVKPIRYKLLSSDGILGMFDNLLKPFVVTEWEGQIPQIGLDPEDPYPLEWRELDFIAQTPIEGSRKIVDAVKKYLAIQPNI
jgi:8-oxo-dGTP pyrophosphatase MutT (NUDIX family)